MSRHVTQLPSFGSFSLHSRTENKRTTLSALFMFVALASEGLSNIKKALQFCNKAIAQDPGWQIPFRKRSEYLSCLGKTEIKSDLTHLSLTICRTIFLAHSGRLQGGDSQGQTGGRHHR